MSDNKTTSVITDAPSPEELESHINGYKVYSIIAQTDKGTVYQANQTFLDRKVAIKLLPKRYGDNVYFRELFEEEAKNMARLNDPNLIAVYDFGDIDGMLYIIMEFVTGKSLYASAHGKSIEQVTATKIIRDVSLGLRHAHRIGVLHRDITPSNILIGQDKIPKIRFFGISNEVDNKSVYGTEGYAAPEGVIDPRGVDERADIYSVGVMFYELLAGEMPGEEYEPLHKKKKVDPRLDEIIEKMMEEDPDDRYESMTILEEELTELLSEIDPDENPDGKPGTKNPMLAKLAVPTRLKPVSVVPKPMTPDTKKTMVRKTAAQRGLSAAVPVQVPDYSPMAPMEMVNVPSFEVNESGGLAKYIVVIVLLLGALFLAFQYKDWKQAYIAKLEKQDAEDQAAEEARRASFRDNDNEGSSQPRRVPNRDSIGRNDGKESSGQDAVEFTGPILIPSEQDYLGELEQSQSALLRGEREKSLFPEVVAFRDNETRAVMFIDEPMTWDEADEWAASYGAYLGISRNSADVTQYANMLESDTTAWLGGGNNGSRGWVWVDGTKWGDFINLAKTRKRAFATVNNFGYMRAESGVGERLPFFIEWRMNKDENLSKEELNPGELEARLRRMATQIEADALNPEFPPGSMSLGVRGYSPIYREVTHSRARALAEMSGGHLLVISNDEEVTFLTNFISSSLERRTECWIGGAKRNSLWKWDTGENWVSLPWVSGFPKNGTRLQIITGDQIKLKDAAEDYKAEMFIIEWSTDEDKARTEAEENKGVAGVTDLEDIKDKHESKLQAKLIKADADFDANIDKLKFDLGVILSNASDGDRKRFESVVNHVTSKVRGKDRIPIDVKGAGASVRMKAVVDYGLRKQDSIKSVLNKDIEKLRLLYMNDLNKFRDKMKKEGQTSILSAISKTFDELGDDADDYLKYFTN